MTINAPVATSARGDLTVTGGGGGGWVPTDKAGLRAWWDASNAASITASGSPARVSQLNDLSGGGHHFVQGTGTGQPYTGTSTIGGKNALDFATGTMSLGTMSGHAAAVIMSGATAATALYVIQYDSDAGVSVPHATLSEWGAPADDYELYTDGGVYPAWGSSIRYTAGNPPQSYTTQRQITIKTGPGLYSYAIDGTVFFTTATNTVSWKNNFVYFRPEDLLGEILLYDSLLTGTDLTNAQGYLKTKWGTP